MKLSRFFVFLSILVGSIFITGCATTPVQVNDDTGSLSVQKNEPISQIPKLVADLEDFRILGDKDALITFVELSDYECPFCKRFTNNILPDIIKEYVDTGIVKFYFTDFTLEIHPGAKLAAIAATCAGYQNEYYPMHDLLFENSRDINKENIIDRANELSLDIDAYLACLDDPLEMEKLNARVNLAKEIGATGTPSFLINGKLLKGAQPFAAFKQIIEAERKNVIELEKVENATCNTNADCKEPSTFPPYCSQTKPNEVCVTSGTPSCMLAGTADSECVMMITEECTPCDDGMSCNEGLCISS